MWMLWPAYRLNSRALPRFTASPSETTAPPGSQNLGALKAKAVPPAPRMTARSDGKPRDAEPCFRFVPTLPRPLASRPLLRHPHQLELRRQLHLTQR